MSEQILHEGHQFDIAHHACTALDDIARNISEAVGDPECYLHKSIVDAVYRGVRDGTSDYLERRK